jgi:hypothetical protein
LKGAGLIIKNNDFELTPKDKEMKKGKIKLQLRFEESKEPITKKMKEMYEVYVVLKYAGPKSKVDADGNGESGQNGGKGSKNDLNAELNKGLLGAGDEGDLFGN